MTDGRFDELEDENRFSYLPTVCLLCGSARHRKRYDIGRFSQGTLHFVTCLDCGTAYQNPAPDQRSMREFYHTRSFFRSKRAGEESGPLVGYRDYDAEERFRQVTAEARLRELEALFRPGRRLDILKVACGYGTLVRVARERGHRADGIDFSKVMVERARDVNGISLICSDFMEHDFGNRRFDVVALYGAINNFRRPMEVAKRAFDLLSPGGFYVTNHMWLDSPPEKLQRERYWIYRPPIVGIYPRREFKRRHEALGFEVHASRCDVQFHSLDKIAGFSQIPILIKVVEKLRIGGVGVTLPVPGYEKVIFRRPARRARTS